MATQISGFGGKEKQVIVNLLVKTQVDQARQDIEKLNATLQSISNKKVTINSSSLSQAVNAASQLQMHLQNAINVDTNKLDLSQLNNSLKNAGTNLNTLMSQLRGAGAEGQQAFTQIARTVASAEVPIARMSGVIKSFGVTLFNTVKWQISSKLIHGITGSISGAFQHAKNLNAALNSIQIVTGSSAEHMAAFANKAREAATALNATTTEYTKASLIFFQQGLDEKAAMDRTNTVIKLSQVTRQSVEDIASQMTAIWNNFDNGTKSLEHYADVITALGANTASSSAEIAQGMQKFAAVAETVGLSYEKAASALATVVANTRLSAEVVGTAFKTILARVDSLKLGDSLDDDVTLNKYAAALQTIGVKVLDSNNNLRKMDDILDELGEKWNLITDAQKTAVATVVAGQRQYAQFMALMNNYDELLGNQKIAEHSEGTLTKQAQIWSDSWEAASKRVEQSQKNLYDSMINSDFMIKMQDIFGSAINSVSGFIKECGGILPVFGMILSMASTQLLPILFRGFSNLSHNIDVWTGKAAQDFAVTQGAIAASLQKTLQSNSSLTAGEKLDLQLTQDLLTKKAALTLAIKNMSEAEKVAAQVEMASYENKVKLVQASIERQIEAEKEVKAVTKLTEAQQKAMAYSLAQGEMHGQHVKNSFYGNEIVQRAQNQSRATTLENINNEQVKFDNKIQQMDGTAAGQAALLLKDTRIVKSLEEQKSQLEVLGKTGSSAYKQIEENIKIVNDRINDNLDKLEQVKEKMQGQDYLANMEALKQKLEEQKQKFEETGQIGSQAYKQVTRDLAATDEGIKRYYETQKQLVPEYQKIDEISNLVATRQTGALDKIMHGLNGYQKGTAHILENLDKENRILEIQIKANEKLLGLKQQNLNLSKQSFGSIPYEQTLIPDANDRNLNVTMNTTEVATGLTENPGQPDIAATEENYAKLATEAKNASLAGQDLANATNEVQDSLKNLTPFEVQDLQAKKKAIIAAQDLANSAAEEVNKKREAVQKAKDMIVADNNSAAAKKALKEATKQLNTAESQYRITQQNVTKAMAAFRASSTDSQRAVLSVAEVVENVKEKFTFSTEASKQFDDALNNLAANPSEETIKAFNDALSRMQQETNMSENELNDIKTAMLQAFPPEIQKRIQAIGQGMENLAQAEHDAAEKLRQLRNAELLAQQEAEKTAQQRVQSFAKVGSTLSQLVMGFQALRNAAKVWSDDDASIMDKITTTMMSMAMILPVMSSGYKILTSNKVKDTLATLEGNTAYQARAIAAAAAWAAEHPVGAALVVAAITAVTAAVTGLVQAHKARAKAAKEANEASMIETGKNAAEATNKILEQATAVAKLTNEYQQLKVAGEDYLSVQQDIINQVPDIINSFQELSKGINLSGGTLKEFNTLIKELELAAASDDIQKVISLNKEISEFLITNEKPAIEHRAKLAAADFLKTARKEKITVSDSDNISGILSYYEGIEKDIQDIENNPNASIEDLSKDTRLERLKKERDALSEVYAELKASADSMNTVEAWSILNDKAFDIQNISTYQDYTTFHDDLATVIQNIAKQQGLNAEDLQKTVDDLLKQEGFAAYQLVDTGISVLKDNLGEEAAEDLKNYYLQADKETQKAFEKAASNFPNILSEEQAKALVELQKTLNLQESAEKAISSLKELDTALKETMTKKDWETVKENFSQSGIDISFNEFKRLAYAEQQNIIQTAKRNNILQNIESLVQGIKDTEDYQKKFTTKIWTENSLPMSDYEKKQAWIQESDFATIYNDIQNQQYKSVVEYLRTQISTERWDELQNGQQEPHKTERPGAEDIYLPYASETDPWGGVADAWAYGNSLDFEDKDYQFIVGAALATFYKNLDEAYEQTGYTINQDELTELNRKTQTEFYRTNNNLDLYQQKIQEAVVDWGAELRDASSLQNLTALVQQGNTIFNGAGLSIDFKTLGDYSQGLLAIAKNYTNATDEIEKYTLALSSNNQEMIAAAEESLVLSTRVGELAEQYSLDAEDTEMQARLIQSAYGFSSEESAEIATRNQRMNRGVKTLVDNFKTWNQTLHSTNILSMDYADILNDVYKALADLTGALDVDHIPIEFLNKTFEDGATALDLMAQAATGNEKAIRRLSKEIVKASFEDLNFNKDTVELMENGALLTELSVNKDAFDQAKLNIVQGIENIYNAIENLAPGTTLEDQIFGGSEGKTQFINSLNEMALATGMTVDEMNAYLAQIGIEIPVDTYPYTTEREIPKLITHREVTRHPGGSDLNYAEDITEWTEESDETTTVKETIPIAMIGKGASVKVKASGSLGGVSPSATKPASTATKAASKNTSDETERYHVINKETDQLTKAYDRLSTAKDRAFGANRLKLMSAEIENLKKQIALNKEYVNQAEAYAQQDYNDLVNGKQNAYAIEGQLYQSEGLRGLGVELQLDENGVIQNYDEIMAAATAKYNERMAAYSANPENSNLKEIAEGEFEAVKNTVSQFEETNELVQAKRDENQKLINQLQDQNLEWFNYKLELKFKINDREKKRIEFELKEIGDDAFKSVEALSKMFSTDGSPSQWSIYLEDLHTYEKSLDDLNELYEKEEISEEGYVEGLEKISNGIYEQLETILDLKDTMEDYYKNTLSKLKEKYDELYASMVKGNEVLEHMKTLLGLIDKSTDYDSIGRLLEGQAEISKNAYDVSRADYEKDKRLRRQREKELQEARKKGGKERIKIAEENLKAAREAEQASQIQMLTDLENYLTKRKEIINNNIEKSYAESDKILSNGMGFDYLNQSMELAAAGAERFYTKTNQLYETDKMRRKLQQDIDKTTNAAAKQRLAAFDREIQQMQDKNKLSKVELSLAQARYELLLAQIALEEAQNAKTTVRLQRDAEGNYGYVYTADQSKIADAEQSVADKQNNLYNTAREAEQRSMQETVKLRQELKDKLQEIDTNEELSDDEKRQRKQDLRAEYFQQLEDLEGDHSLALEILNETSATHMNDTWTNNFKEVMENNTEMIDSFISEQDRLDEYLYGKDGQGGAFKDLANAARDVLGVELSKLGTIISNNTTESKKFKEELIGADGKGGLVKATEKEANAVAKTTIEFGKAYDKADAYFKKLKEVNEQIDDLIKKAAHEITLKTKIENSIMNYVDTIYTETGERPPIYSKSAGTGGSGGDYQGSLLDLFGNAIETTKPYYTVTISVKGSNSPPIQTFVTNKQNLDTLMESFGAKAMPGKKYASDILDKIIIESHNSPKDEDQMNNIKIVPMYVYKVRNPETNSNSKWIPMDTGGYTGQWYHSSDDPIASGKLAMLHEKELVLNQEDTKNFLASIEMVRDLARIIDLQAASVGLRQQLEARFGFDAAQSELAQNIVINADFPNATDHNEIMEALETLADRAAQYANRTNRLIDSMQQRR